MALIRMFAVGQYAFFSDHRNTPCFQPCFEFIGTAAGSGVGLNDYAYFLSIGFAPVLRIVSVCLAALEAPGRLTKQPLTISKNLFSVYCLGMAYVADPKL